MVFVDPFGLCQRNRVNEIKIHLKVDIVSDMADVVNPLELTYKVVFPEWVMSGSRARRILPTICVHL